MTPAHPIRLETFTDISQISESWQRLERESSSTFYQSLIWCRAWQETIGNARKVQPVIVAGFDQMGIVQFLMPFQTRRRLGLKVLEWLGAPHGNYGTGLIRSTFRPEAAAWFGDHWPEVLAAAGKVDCIALKEIPAQLQGHANPLASHFNLRGANRSFAMRLPEDFAAFYEKSRKGEDRRSTRKKEAALAKQGAVTFGLPKSKAEVHATLDVMFRQQEGRLAERGVHGVFGPLEQAFVHRIADLQDDDQPILAPFTFSLDGTALAVLLGGLHQGTYWALISSLAAGPHRKLSPGDLALRRTIEACSAMGLETLDFSSGESAYKLSWADETIDLHGIVRACTLPGLVLAAILWTRESAKRQIKQTPVLMTAFAALRRLLRGKSATPT